MHKKGRIALGIFAIAILAVVVVCLKGNINPGTTQKQIEGQALSVPLSPPDPVLPSKSISRIENKTNYKRDFPTHVENKMREITDKCWRNFNTYKATLLNIIRKKGNKKIRLFAINEFAKYEKNRIYEKLLLELAKKEEDSDIRIALFEAAKKIKLKNRPPTPFDFYIASKIVEKTSLRANKPQRFVKIECKVDFFNDVKGTLTLQMGQLKTKKYRICGKEQRAEQVFVSFMPEEEKIVIPCCASFRQDSGWFYQACGQAEISFKPDKDPTIKIKYPASDARGSKNRLHRR